MTVRSCLTSMLVALAALARGQDIYSGSSGGFSLQWTPSDIRVSRAGTAPAPISFRRFAEAQWKDLARDARGQSLTQEVTYRVLSFVGPYLSVAIGEDCD